MAVSAARFIAIMCLTALAAWGLTGCERESVPTGKWQGSYYDGEWLIAVRIELMPGDVIRVSAPMLKADFAHMQQREREQAWIAIQRSLDRQFREAAPGAVKRQGSEIIRRDGYAPLFEIDGNALIFMFYSNGFLTHRIPLQKVAAFDAIDRPKGY
ncbi:MAG: hypothetical protein HXY22_12750 [Alphaproteobacteria bacterium]|nr:hypothetical protein [Alphaproteobacteria bacterium]